MERDKLARHILERYGAAEEHLWERYPTSGIFRHSASRKWFALITEVDKSKLGIGGGGKITVVNLKGDPLDVSLLKAEPGFYPAYHMNKENWVSVDLGSVEEERIKALLEVSFDLAAPKVRRKG